MSDTHGVLWFLLPVPVKLLFTWLLTCGTVFGYGGFSRANDSCLFGKDSPNSIFETFYEPNDTEESYLGSDIRLNMYDIRKRIWYLGYGGFTRSTPEDADRGFSASTYGLLVGCDRQVGRFGMVGFGLGGDWSSVEKKNDLYSSEISAVKTLVHASLGSDRWYAAFEGGYTGGEHKSRNFPNRKSAPQRRTEWNNAWRFGAEIGFHWERGFAKTEPFFSIHRTSMEKSDGDDLVTVAALGCRHSWRFAGPLAIVRPGLFGGYLHQFGDELFSGGTWIPNATVYEVPGGKLPRDRIFLGLNTTMSMRKSMDLYFKYSSELARDHDAHTVLCGMNWNF